MDSVEEIIEHAKVSGIYILEGFDEALLGVEVNDDKLVYSVGKVLQILIDNYGLSYDEASEHLEGKMIYDKSMVLCWAL